MKNFLKSLGKQLAIGFLEALAEAAQSGRPLTSGNVLIPALKATEKQAITIGTQTAIDALQPDQK